MKDESKTKKQLIRELMEYRQRDAKLEASEGLYKTVNENSDLLSNSKSQTKPAQSFLRENQEILEYLKKSRLFSYLPNRIFEQLLSLSHFEDYPSGSEILIEGAVNTKVFFLIGGAVGVYAGGNKISKLRRKGDIFGEMSIISKKPCSASIIAETPVKLFSIKAKHIGEYTDIETNELENILYRLFAMILTDKLSLTNKKAQQYETIHKDLLREIDERKKYTKALKESESRYRLLADNVMDVLFTIDKNWNYTFVSPSVKKLLGYEPEELIGTSFFDTVPPLTRKKIDSFLKRKKGPEASGQPSQGQSRNMEMEIYRKDGSLVWVESNSSSLWDENQQFIGIIGISRDVTGRRLMTEKLQESEEKFRTLAERCPFAIMIFQNDYWVYANPVVEIISGYTPEDLYRMRFWEVVHPDHREMVQERGRKRQSGQAVPQSYDLKIIHKTGREVWVSLSGGDLMYEGKSAGLITIKDITERKKTEVALQESERRYRLLADNVSDNIWVFDLGTMRFSYSSPSIEGITGFTEEEAVGSRLKDTMTPLSVERVNKLLKKDLTAASRNFDPARSRTVELELYKKNGLTVWTETAWKFIYDQKSQPIALLGATRDISERNKLQEQLHKSQKMESLGLLAGGVAHDLNNVLSGIVSYPELLLMNLPDGSKLRKPLKTIMDSGIRAAAIVQDLLTIARGVVITKEALKLNDLVADYFDSPEFKKLKQFYPEVTFKTHLADDLLNIEASDVHIRKVLMNLVANAAEAVGKKGNVSVSTDNRFLDRPLNGYEEIDAGEYVVFSVADDGPGISVKDLKRVFEPFYTKKKMGRSGTGLGLSVVWNVMRDHKGNINVKSDGDGTFFELYFPITRDAVLKKDINLSLTSYKGSGETILIVDDIESQREISSRMLDMLGYNYKAVSSGEKAIEYLKQNTVDLILLDMIMEPGINGYEAYKRIIKIHPGQKTIILSGFSETDDVKKTQSLGVGQYLKKPITLEKLGMAIKEELKK
jgi:PAS domain S-box-containing protein